MNKLTQYLIAACKSTNEHNALRIVYEMFYHSDFNKDKVNQILMKQFSDIIKFDLSEFYTKATDFLNNGRDLVDVMSSYLVNKIAFTSTDYFREYGYSLSYMDVTLLEYGFIKGLNNEYKNSEGHSITLLSPSSFTVETKNTVHCSHQFDDEVELTDFICKRL